MKPNTALLVIDVQVGMFPASDPVYAGDVILGHVQSLIRKARSCHVPVIYVQHNENPGEPLESNSSGWQIHPLIAPADGDAIVQKRKPDAFFNTNLQEILASKAVKNLVVAGLQTDMCVNETSRRAHSLGYRLVIASDAHSTWSQGSETATEIIDRHNDQFREFAQVEESSEIQFC